MYFEHDILGNDAKIFLSHTLYISLHVDCYGQSIIMARYDVWPAMWQSMS